MGLFTNVQTRASAAEGQDTKRQALTLITESCNLLSWKGPMKCQVLLWQPWLHSQQQTLLLIPSLASQTLPGWDYPLWGRIIQFPNDFILLLGYV